MSKFTAMIVDDEELARAVIREMLGAHPEIEIVAECANGFEAVRAAADRKPDLMFLDVQMPKLDGFEVLELLEGNIAVIFVTAYDMYAMRAFEVHAVDYLLKPASTERFEEALERAKQRIGQRIPPAPELAAIARSPGHHLERIVIRDGTRVHIIAVAKIDYLEAQDDYVAVHSAGKTYLKQQTLSGIEAALDPARFIRVHRSYIVNLERIEKVEPLTKDTRVAVLTDSSRIPVSQNGYIRLSELLSQ